MQNLATTSTVIALAMAATLWAGCDDDADNGVIYRVTRP